MLGEGMLSAVQACRSTLMLKPALWQMRMSGPVYCTIQAATFRQAGALATISAVMPCREVL
jgi:hypothetical protein